MRCFNCGEEVGADEKFCYRCGFEQAQVVRFVEAAKNGSQDAITELYKRTYNNVYQSVRMMISDEDTVLDIVQDTYIRGFKYLNQLEDPRLFKAWIKRIGVNTAKNYLKKKKPILFSEMGGGGEDDRPELQFEDDRVENLPEVSMDKRETARIIKEVLDTLSEDQRMVITMYYYEDMNAREIADELGLSENTIRSRLNYGKKKIEAKILEIEKRDGIRLHTLAPVVFMAALFHSQEASAAEVPNPMMLQEIKRALLSNAGRTGARTAAEDGAGSRARSAAKAAGVAAAKGISAKVIAGIAAAVVAAGGGTAYVVHEYNVSRESQAVNQDEAENQDALNEAADANTRTDETGTEDSKADGTADESTSKAEDSQAEAPYIRPWEAAADGLTAFAQGQEMLSGSSYNGYLANIVNIYDGAEYTSPGPDGSQLPQGWLDYSLADLDGDGEPELVAATVNAAAEAWLKEPVNVIGIEVYEWDSETESAYLASSMLTQPVYEGDTAGIRVAQSFGTLDCFIYGDGKKRIGFIQDYTMAPVFDGGGFDFQAFGYQDGELKSEMHPVNYAGTEFGEPEVQEKMKQEAQEMAQIGVPINPNQVLTGEISGGDISQYVANYHCVARVESQYIIESADAVYAWMDKAYSGEAVESLEAYIINCSGGDSHDLNR